MSPNLCASCRQIFSLLGFVPKEISLSLKSFIDVCDCTRKTSVPYPGLLVICGRLCAGDFSYLVTVLTGYISRRFLDPNPAWPDLTRRGSFVIVYVCTSTAGTVCDVLAIWGGGGVSFPNCELRADLASSSRWFRVPVSLGSPDESAFR